ncbi:MAG: type II toxin-antitoxin system HicA family toxin [Planctomycetales bacterium]|nr:type II toxin-antitoxin system HicA family toxin [Planctomycetales bacterium]
MRSVSGKELCRIVERHGWELKRIRGSHHIYAKPGVPVILTIPVHAGRDLKKGTLRAILKLAGLTAEDVE